VIGWAVASRGYYGIWAEGDLQLLEGFTVVAAVHDQGVNAGRFWCGDSLGRLERMRREACGEIQHGRANSVQQYVHPALV